MSNPHIYLKYHDAYRDTGDFGGDIHRAMDDVSEVLDESGIKVTRVGKVYAEVEPLPAPRQPEEIIWAEREVQVYPTGVSGKDNPKPTHTVTRSVPVKRIPQRVLLPGEQSATDFPYDRALVRAHHDTMRPKVKGETVCPFNGTLSMLWYSIKADARQRKINLDEDQLNDTLRMIQKSIPETMQPNFALFQHFATRITSSEDFHSALSCMQRDFSVAATELHKLKDFTQEREVQLGEAAKALGCRPEELVSCDMYGNVIGGRGAFLTDQGRWTDEKDDDGQNGELYADYHSPQRMEDQIKEQVRRDAFNNISTGAGMPDHQLIFDPSNMISKPLGREFHVEVPTFTLFFWPKGYAVRLDNLKRFDVAGFWGDIKRDVVSQFPSTDWEMEVIRGEKTEISTTEPVYRRPSWHLGCMEPTCTGVKYYFDCDYGTGADETTELARLTATPDEWMGPDDQEMAVYKRQTEEMIGATLYDALNTIARKEHCPQCNGPLMYVNPVKEFQIDGRTVRVPHMTICHNYDWWQKPEVMNNWTALLQIYGGDKIKASERMDTISTPTGIMYAEQAGDTTYTWKLDWLQQDAQVEVRKLMHTIPEHDLTDIKLFKELQRDINATFTKKQRRFLIDQLYARRAEQQWAIVESSKFVAALRRKLSKVTMDTFHDTYNILSQLLMRSGDKLTFAEKNYGWALLNGLKTEFQLNAERMLLTGEGCELYHKWVKGLKHISFRHLTVVNQRSKVLNAQPESVFLIREAVKAARRRLAAVARTTSWITAQEDYLHSVEAGDIRPDQSRIDDMVAASWLAQSAGHLATRVQEVLNDKIA